MGTIQNHNQSQSNQRSMSPAKNHSPPPCSQVLNHKNRNKCLEKDYIHISRICTLSMLVKSLVCCSKFKSIERKSSRSRHRPHTTWQCWSNRLNLERFDSFFLRPWPISLPPPLAEEVSGN